MEIHREVRLSSPDDADTNDEVVLKRVVKMTGGGQVSLTFKKHHRGDEGDYFTLNPVGVKEIELLDNN
jgi:hypothetical protein